MKITHRESFVPKRGHKVRLSVSKTIRRPSGKKSKCARLCGNLMEVRYRESRAFANADLAMERAFRIDGYLGLTASGLDYTRDPLREVCRKTVVLPGGGRSCPSYRR